MVAAHDVHGHFADRDGFGWGVDAEELRRFFLEYEATIGFRSTFHAMLAAKEGVAMGSGPPANWDPYAAIVPAISEAKRVYRRLRAMESSGHRRELVILWRLYGPRNAHADRSADFGDDRLASDAAALAPLTEAAQNARDELVLRESSERAERTGKAVAASRQATIDALEEIFWREVGVIAKAEAAVHRLDELPEVASPNIQDARERLARARAAVARETATEEGPTRAHMRVAKLERQLSALEARAIRAPARADQHARRYEAGWTLLGQIIEAITFDGTIRARTSSIEAADREITVEDAIREVLDGPRRKHSSKEAAQAAKAAKAAFVTAVRIEAHRMRREAHEAYRAAKRGLS